MNNLRPHPLLSQLQNGIFSNELTSSSWPLVVFLSLTHSLFAISVDGQLLYPCHKTPLLYSCESPSLGISLEGLRLAGKKGYYLRLAGYKNVTAMYFDWFFTLPRLKTQSPGRIYKVTLPAGKAWRKEAVQRHARAHPPTHTHIYAHTHTGSYWYPYCECQLLSSALPLRLTSLECSWCFIAPGTQSTCHLHGH